METYSKAALVTAFMIVWTVTVTWGFAIGPCFTERAWNTPNCVVQTTVQLLKIDQPASSDFSSSSDSDTNSSKQSNQTAAERFVERLAEIHLQPYFEDKDWTEWICQIQNAKVYQIQKSSDIDDDDNNECWMKDNTCIQIRRMSERDFPISVSDDNNIISDINIPGSEHFYDDMIDVVKLPMAIPGFELEDCAQFLFLRPDDYQLFYCMQQSTIDKKFVLLGNPGISKSWFHYKYILFCYHPEIYNRFRPLYTIEDGEMVPVCKANHEDNDVHVKDQGQEIPRDIKFADIGTMPQVIVRTISGKLSQIFFVDSSESVLVVDHEPRHLALFTTEKMTILWEPDEGSTPVPSSRIKARIIVTTSPLLKRFKEFKKNKGIVLHMPCPSLVQLRLMGQILRAIVPDYIYTDTEIQTIAREYGPFIRLAVVKRKGNVLGDFLTARRNELTNLNSVDLITLVTLNEHVMLIEENKQIGFSHRLARYFVRRDHKEEFFGYTIPRFRCTSIGAFNAIDSKITTLPDINVIVDILIDINKVAGMLSSLEDFNYKMFEQLVQYYVQTVGLTWYRCAMPVKESKSRYSTKGSSVWGTFSIKKKYIFRELTLFKDMEIGKFYYPSDPFFPLVDMYWKEENGELYGIQISISLRHPKSEKVYKLFFEKLGLESMDVRFNLHYVILPFQKEQLKYIEFPEMYFYEGNITEGFGEKFRFYALSPPKTFAANISTNFQKSTDTY